VFYLFFPGIIALLFYRKEKLKIPLFLKINRYLFFAFIIPMVISSIAFFAATFGKGFVELNFEFNDLTMIKKIVYVMFYYIFTLMMYAIALFLSELYWRGYLWDKLKKYQYKAICLIAFLWTLWITIVDFFYQPSFRNWKNILLSFALHFVLAPILIYYRVNGKSIISPVIFLSSLYAFPVFLGILFPLQTEDAILRSLLTLFLVLLYAAFLHVFAKKNWKIKESTSH
jgi:hypothetical protein